MDRFEPRGNFAKTWKKNKKKRKKVLTFLLKGGILKYRKKQVVRTSKTYKDIKEKKDKKKEIKDWLFRNKMVYLKGSKDGEKNKHWELNSKGKSSSVDDSLTQSNKKAFKYVEKVGESGQKRACNEYMEHLRY